MGHIVSSLHLLKERIFVFMCNLNFFLVWFVCIYFSPPPKFSYFSQNLFCFSYFYRGRNLFLKPMLFIGRVASILYRAGFICFLYSLFSLDFCYVCFLYTLCLSCLCQYMTKRGRNRWNMGILFVLFMGSWNYFWKGEKIKFFDVSNLRGEFEFIYFIDSYCLYVFLSTHTLMCSFECFR